MIHSHLPPEARRQVMDFIVFLRTRYEVVIPMVEP
jgi:hypothetical protein